MSKYTFENLIVNPESPNLKSLIGKKVYYHDIPRSCLDYANENLWTGTLKEICKDDFYPFRVETSDGCILHYACIIPKKEEPKPEFVPFESAEEFLDAYYRNENKKLDGIYRYLATRGIWIKGKGTCTSYYMVTEIWDDGVIIGDSKINTTQVSSDRYFTANETTEWEELFNKYTFLDGSPCGKEVR